MPPSVLIFGAGNIGICYSYVFLAAGANVTAICRSNFETASQNGFSLESPDWGSHTELRPVVVKSINEVSVALGYHWDFIVVCTKALPSMASLLAPAMSFDTAVVLLQNGIGIERSYEALYPGNTIISGVVNLPATQIGQGHVTVSGSERLSVGTYPSEASQEHKQRATMFAALAARGGSTVEVVDDVQTDRWSKIMANAAISPLAALTRLSVQNLIQAEGGFILCRQAMLDIVMIANAEGYDHIDHETVEHLLTSGIPPSQTFEPSMLGDIRSERQMETWAVLGNALDIANKHGLQVPTLRTIYWLSECLNKSAKLGSLNQTTEQALSGFHLGSL